MNYSRYQNPYIVFILFGTKGVSANDKLRTAVPDHEGKRRDLVPAGEAGLPAVQLLRHEARRQCIDPHHQPALPPAAMPRGGRDGVYRRRISEKPGTARPFRVFRWGNAFTG